MDKDDDKPLSNMPTAVSAMPTEYTRGPLFAMPRKGPRQTYFETNVPLYENKQARATMIYTGQQLDIKDLVVYLACIRLTKMKSIGESAFISLADILRECGLKVCTVNRQRVRERLWRLAGVNIGLTIQTKRGTKRYRTGLLVFIQHTTNAGESVSVALSRGSEDLMNDLSDARELFKELAYISWDTFISLETDLARRFMTFIVGHEQGKQQFRRLDDLQTLLGHAGELRHFRAELKAAAKVLEARGVIKKDTFRIVKGVVQWQRGYEAVDQEQPGSDDGFDDDGFELGCPF